MLIEILLSIKLAIRHLRSNIGRTTLSLLGIVIGVASVILVLSLGAGVKNFVIDQISSFGTDIIEVEVKVPKVSKTSAQNAGGIIGGTQITSLKLGDAEEIAKLSNVGPWYASVMSQQVVSFENKKKRASLMGATTGVAQADEKAQIDTGEMFSEEDDSDLKEVVVLGSDLKNYLFGDNDAVGKYIKVKGQNYRVMGVLKKRGMVAGFNFDEIIYIPLQTLQKKLMGIDYLQFAIFKLKDMNRIDSTIQEVTEIMRDRHKITNPDDDDFAVSSIAEVASILDKVFFIINALLLALTSISLVVGGVGIMNVMYVAVAERTFEIGLKKSVGASKFDILSQFLLEAIFLTILGGIIGLLIGWVIANTAEIIASNFGYFLRFSVTWWAVAIGFGFSAVTGIVFGYYPARRASQLTPMEALRKE